MKVCAIEPETQTEAVVVVPRGLTEQQMQYQALQKLSYILKKRVEEKQS